jgi:Fungal specific transcription factor domain
VLLCEHFSRTSQHRLCFMLSAFVVRIAQSLLLDTEQDDVLKSHSPEEVTIAESRRRLMWSCYIVDLLMCSGVQRLMLWDPKNIKIQLPCQERNYSLQIPCQTESLGPSHISADVGQASDNLGIEAYCIRLFHIRGKVLR